MEMYENFINHFSSLGTFLNQKIKNPVKISFGVDMI